MAPTNDIRRFAGALEGQAVLVCGCGESLNELQDPTPFITIGVNDIGRLFDPTYLVVVNPRSQFKADRFRFVEQSRAQHLFTQLDLGRVDPPVVKFTLGKYGGTEIGDGDALPYTQNSPYVAVCLAAYMGARRIGLIGVDFTDHHFFARTGRHPLAGRLQEIDAQYGRLAAALRERGVELVNLSTRSRLTSLPRMSIEADGGFTRLAPQPAVAIATAARAPLSRINSMKVAIERRAGPLVGAFLEALAASAARLGHTVVRDPCVVAHDPKVLSIVWNGRTHRSRGPTLYCEHGWLPRWAYQVSAGGINADSHLAPFMWNGKPLDEVEMQQLAAHLEQVRSRPPAGFEYMQTTREEAAGLPDAFLLVPLQMEWDTNIVRHAPAALRSMQALVDTVERADPPWPIIFKQHPADVRRGNAQLRLRLRRRQNAIWPHPRGNVYQMLKSERCRAIVTINSNVAHDGLLWDVPAVVLGRNIWPSAGAVPFRTKFPEDWEAFAASRNDPAIAAGRHAYAWYLKRGQWTLEDAANPERVAELLESARPRPAPARVPSVAATLSLATVNVAAVNRGWVFEDLKALFARHAPRDVRVVTSERPMPNADAWIFLRTKEAAATRDPARTLVQIHDMFDHGLYEPGGERHAVGRCAAVALSHPDQRRILESSGIDLHARIVIERPLGWQAGFEVRQSLPPKLTVAWVGRPAVHYGVEVKRVDWLVDALAGLPLDLQVVLLGDRLEAAAARMKAARIAYRYVRHREFPVQRYPELYAGFDCVVITSSTEAGPLPLFEAMACGIPVISTPVGWAPRLIDHGVTGVLVDDVPSLREAIRELAGTRAQWFERRHAIRAKVDGMRLESWIDANLQAAGALARREDALLPA